MKVRIKFSKEGPVKFVGHLDTMRYFQKAIRRANLPVAFSGGYSPHMIMSFAAPLGVSEEAYIRARRRANHMMAHGKLYRFNVLGLVLCAMHIRWQRRRHYFCSQFVSDGSQNVQKKLPFGY